METNKLVKEYLATALWASIGDNDDPLDKEYGIDDFAESAIEIASQDIALFLAKAIPLGLENLSQGMHDFWLTRNGHGAGFWDGDYPEKLGQDLTDLSTQFGECTAYIGDDNQIYFA